MSDSIRITASLRIERPAEVVREQFRDIDHHIRKNIHPDIVYAWEPAPPGVRRIRTTFHILGAPQYDVADLEDAPDGSLVIRYLHGTNSGTVLVQRFVPLGPNATEVQLEAQAPATLSRKLLGPLFVSGARQVMLKALAENKRDIEGGFETGKAAGNLDRALAFLTPAPGKASFVRPISERDAVAKRAVLEAACLVAVADGEVQAGELDAIIRVAQVVGLPDARPWLEERARALSTVARSPEIVTEATRIGQALVGQKVGLEGITVAVLIALVSDGMSLGELELLRELARVAGVSDGSLPALVETVERALNAA